MEQQNSTLLVDSHAHLNELADRRLSAIFDQENPKLVVISNSADVESSRRNLKIAKKFRSIIPFYGIHPEIFSRPNSTPIDVEHIDSMVTEIKKILSRGSGIGEVGLDSKYGSLDSQKYLFEKMLSLAESTSFPVTLHCRESVSAILETIASYNLKGKILFHWFAGTEEELGRVNERGMYTTYGPSILFSKRLSRLLSRSDPELLLSETDTPTRFNSLTKDEGNPLMIASVYFKMAATLKISFDSLREKLLQNTNEYLGTQTSLRVKSN
ncbi:MAG: TatD family hydrolase [Nitrososphaerales archaeon]